MFKFLHSKYVLASNKGKYSLCNRAIIYTTRITSNSHTLIDNIFSNSLNFSDGISGNLTISISEHLAQFLLIPEQLPKIPKKQNRLKSNTKNFDHENFILDLLNIDWTDVININQNDANSSFNSFGTTINALIDQYMSIKNDDKEGNYATVQTLDYQ